MHKRRLCVLLMSLFILGSNINVDAEGLSKAFIVSSIGETLDIDINSKDSTLKSSDESVAKIEDGLVKVIGEGTCDLVDKSGAEFTVKSDGSSNASIRLDYSLEDGKLELNATKAEGKRVEVNAPVEVGETKSVPENVLVGKDGVCSVTKSGTYYVGNTVLTAYMPTLSKTEIDSSAGYTEKISLSDDLSIKSAKSSNEKVAKVSEDGVVTLVGEGSAEISVDTGNNVLKCTVKSVIPKVDTKEVKIARGTKYTIEVTGNKANLPVEYSVKEGTCKVSSEGVVSGISGSSATIHVKIGSFEYDKKINVYDRVLLGAESFFSDAGEMSESRKQIWEKMKPAILKSLGTPYVMGGTTPGVALDCSGYASYVWRTAGLMSGRMTAQGLYNYSKRTNTPQPGDLVFFHSTYDPGDGRYITHVGVYAGNGMMYHSGEPNQKVSLNNSYWKAHFAGYGTF